MVTVITVIIAGIILVALVAVVVGIVDAAQAASWRQVAAERREQWEKRVMELHGGIEVAEQDGDDD